MKRIQARSQPFPPANLFAPSDALQVQTDLPIQEAECGFELKPGSRGARSICGPALAGRSRNLFGRLVLGVSTAGSRARVLKRRMEASRAQAEPEAVV